MSCYMTPMHKALLNKLPEDKTDTDKAEAIIALGYPAVEPVLPILLEWMKDLNWPVAQTLWPFLASIGAPLAPYIRPILKTNDDLWKYWIVICVVAESKELTLALVPELERLAVSATDGEREEKLDELAQNMLKRLKAGTDESVLPKAYRS